MDLEASTVVIVVLLTQIVASSEMDNVLTGANVKHQMEKAVKLSSHHSAWIRSSSSSFSRLVITCYNHFLGLQANQIFAC